MTLKRLTKEDIRSHSGILNPVGHTILGLPDDAHAANAAAALRAAGFAPEDILEYQAADATERLRERVRTASEAAGFGHELTLMRRYLALAEKGAGWLIVYSPDDAKAKTIVDIATRFGALRAVRYHRLASEDLI